MESEKVKEIKKGLEFQRDGLVYLENNCVEIVYCKDILTLINDLESENERLSNALEDNVTAYEDGFQDGASLKGRIENKWVKENQQLKDRIAELEKENEILQGTKDRLTFADKIKLVDNAVERKLKQFAEMLKDEIDEMKQFFDSCLDREYCGLTKDQVDENLKEFIK